MNRPGFFGKLPSAGDFVARGITPAMQKYWDTWISREILMRFGRDVTWPEGGLRFARDGVAGALLPSWDKPGRPFPMLFLIQFTGGLPQVTDIDTWIEDRADLINASLSGTLSPSDLQKELEARPSQITASNEATGQMLLWRFGSPALSCDPRSPEDALGQILRT